MGQRSIAISAEHVIIGSRSGVQHIACRWRHETNNAYLDVVGHILIFCMAVNVHWIRAIPNSWERKRLACADAGTPPSPNSPPQWGEDRWGALNDYVWPDNNAQEIVRIQEKQGIQEEKSIWHELLSMDLVVLVARVSKQ
jgi:hypothetical protein